MSAVGPTTEQTSALADQILSLVSGIVDVPPHLRAIAGHVAKAALVRTLEGGDAQELLAKITHAAELGRQLIAALKD